MPLADPPALPDDGGAVDPPTLGGGSRWCSDHEDPCVREPGPLRRNALLNVVGAYVRFMPAKISSSSADCEFAAVFVEFVPLGSSVPLASSAPFAAMNDDGGTATPFQNVEESISLAPRSTGTQMQPTRSPSRVWAVCEADGHVASATIVATADIDHGVFAFGALDTEDVFIGVRLPDTVTFGVSETLVPYERPHGLE